MIEKIMRDRMERLVLLPFSVGCVSESSIAVAVQHQHQPRSRSSSKPAAASKSSSAAPRKREEDEESISSDQSMKSSFRFLANSKPDIATGFHRIFKTVKNISQLFVYKEEMEELEKEMEIGFPTDVKHVTHIGLDGSVSDNNNNNTMKGWENLISPPLLTTIPSVSLDQFELSMAAQAQDKPPAAPVKDSNIQT